jgi:hypothetical protein
MDLMSPLSWMLQRSRHVSKLTLGATALTFFASLSYGATKRPFPQKNKLPISPESYCSGQEGLFKRIKQPIKDEFNLLCQAGKPTPLFTTMVTTAYDGTNAVNYTPIKVGPSAENPGWVDVKVAFSMRVKKTAVQILRAEEALVGPNASFKSTDLNIFFEYDTPTPIEGDTDTAFNIKQRTQRQNGARRFDDNSKHSLKLYRVMPNNFDFLLAARTLIEDNAEISKTARLFKKSTILRAAMTDPKDPNYGIVTTVLGFLISDQEGQDDRVETIFVNYINADILNVFKFHSTPK